MTRASIVAALLGGAMTGLPAQERWTLTPALRISSASEPRAEWTQVSSLLALPSGQIVVSDARARRLSVFDARGKWVRDIGRVGRGPGEFESLGRIDSRPA